MCMTGASLPSFSTDPNSVDVTMLENLNLSFDQVPVNEEYSLNFKREASSDAQPSNVQAIAGDSGCEWSEANLQFTIPEGASCQFAVSTTEDNVTNLSLYLLQGDTLIVSLTQPDEMTQGGSTKPVQRLAYDSTPTPIPSITPTSSATADPNATSTPTPVPTSAAATPVIPTSTPVSYQIFEQKTGVLTMNQCNFYEDVAITSLNQQPTARTCIVIWSQGDNSGDAWWKGWVSGDYTWSGFFSRD